MFKTDLILEMNWTVGFLSLDFVQVPCSMDLVQSGIEDLGK